MPTDKTPGNTSGKTPGSSPASATPPAWQIGSAGAALIKHYESCAKAIGGGQFDAYPDPGTGGDPWTIGWGTTGADIKKGLIWTQAQCDARFDHDILTYVATVAQVIGKARTSQNQFDAMVSFHYNTGKLPGSTLLKLHIAGDFAGAAAQFGKWTHAAGKVLPGLITRRAAEAAMYATPDAPAAKPATTPATPAAAPVPPATPPVAPAPSAAPAPPAPPAPPKKPG